MTTTYTIREIHYLSEHRNGMDREWVTGYRVERYLDKRNTLTVWRECYGVSRPLVYVEKRFAEEAIGNMLRIPNLIRVIPSLTPVECPDVSKGLLSLYIAESPFRRYIKRPWERRYNNDW